MKLDLHTHPLPKKGFLESLVEQAIFAKMDVIAITNFHNDNRYQFFRQYVEEEVFPVGFVPKLTERGFEITKTCYSNRRDDENRDTYKKKRVKFIKGQEIPTKEGHVLTVGATGHIKGNQSLEDTLKKARDLDAIIIADHPYVPQNIWGGIGEENLLRFLEYWDAVEWNEQCIDLFSFPRFLKQSQANKKVEEFSKKYDIPLVADSDAHFVGLLGNGGSLRQIGLSYISMPSLQYENDEQFIRQLRRNIRERNYTNIKQKNDRIGFLRWCIPLYIQLLLE